MKIICQVVKSASVSIDNMVYNQIDYGYLLYVGFTHNDTAQTVEKIAMKISKLRINQDENGKTNLDGIASNCQILSISQFTLYGNCAKGNRPSFTEAMDPSKASILYDLLNQRLIELGYDVKSGIFGANMNIESVNQGPMTFILEMTD